jgi:hypothetical protein
MKILRLASAFGVVLAISSLASSALAQNSGYVTGSVNFWQNQGHFCNDTSYPFPDPRANWPVRDCTDAKFKDDHAQQYRPIRRVLLVLRDANNNTIGATNSGLNGEFTLGWQTSGPLTGASLHMYLSHSQGAGIYPPTGSALVWYAVDYNLSLIPGGGTLNVGWRGWGGAGSPEPYSNLYDGLHMALDAVWQHDLWFAFIGGTTVRAFTNNDLNGNPTCTTSCAWGPQKLIHIDAFMSTFSAYVPQSRIMHELGHLVSWQSTPFQSVPANSGMYSWTSTTNTNETWSLNTSEWRHSAYEEGVASFFANISLYGPAAPAPHDCPGAPNTPCATGTFNVEASSGFGTALCPAQAGVNESDRYALTVMRYLWDMYDTTQDTVTANACDGDGMNASYTDIHTWSAHTLFQAHRRPINGVNNHQRDKPFTNTFYNVLEAPPSLQGRDGRSVFDYRWHFQDAYGVNTRALMCMNCMNPAIDP